MARLLSKPQYEEWTAATRDTRMAWWRAARFGMFVHYGLFSQVGRHEWYQFQEDVPVKEYERLAETFQPRPGVAREWAALARQAGMKYMVLTTRHCEGFSLWDSRANPYNAVRFGPKRDLVREFVEACREYDLKIGFYLVGMDWHHPDGWTCAYDTEARERFTRFFADMTLELMTGYGKIDVLWYDCPLPLENWQGLDSLELNQQVRSLQPDIIINNRSFLAEDYGTPEGEIQPAETDWEACMTFNDISWGYVDSQQAAPYSYNAPRIIAMLSRCCANGGNLLLNIGPAADGSVPPEAVEPLTTVGRWLEANGRAVYGRLRRATGWKDLGSFSGNGVSAATADERHVYIWNKIWPTNGSMVIAGYLDRPVAVRLLADGRLLDFDYAGHRIILRNLPQAVPDQIAGVTVIELEFDRQPEHLMGGSYSPFLMEGSYQWYDKVAGRKEEET